MAACRSLRVLALLHASVALAQSDPVLNSRAEYTLAVRAYDPIRRVFYIGSVRHRKILRVSSTGAVSDFVTVQRDSVWAPMGMKVDPARRALWVAVAARPQMLGYNSADSGRSGLFRYDLKTGKLGGRYLIRPDGAYHVLGDLTIGKRGDVYTTDSRTPAIYWIPSGSDSLEKFVESPLLLSAQGLALTPDERWLYVAEYARGILRADLHSRSMSSCLALIRWPRSVSTVCIGSVERS